MTNEDARAVHKRYAGLLFTPNENNAINDCYMQGVYRNGHVWVTWTDVERLICDLKEVEDESKTE